MSEVQKWSDSLDIVINATGFDVRKSLTSHSEEEINQTMAINLIGAILFSKHFLPLLKNQKGATIVHSGGFADGRLAFPYYSVDVASRAGLFSFIESMNRELKQEQKKMYLLKGIKSHKRVILMGQATKIFATLNLLSPSIADHLLLKRYGHILKKYFG